MHGAAAILALAESEMAAQEHVQTVHYKDKVSLKLSL
jgi:hypothetical protein